MSLRRFKYSNVEGILVHMKYSSEFKDFGSLATTSHAPLTLRAQSMPTRQYPHKPRLMLAMTHRPKPIRVARPTAIIGQRLFCKHLTQTGTHEAASRTHVPAHPPTHPPKHTHTHTHPHPHTPIHQPAHTLSHYLFGHPRAT